MDNLAIAVLTAGAAFLVYLRTACRTVYVGDSGELAAAVHTLGIAHPPGYPLYVLLGKLFCVLVPIGRPVLRLNLFSASCATVSVGCLFGTLVTLGFSEWPASATALAWGLTASLWSQSGIARVYALGACISALITLLAMQWYMEPAATGWLLAAVLVIGLGLANHPVAGMHLPALAALVAVREPSVLADVGLWALAGACLLPGLALYAWIPLRARANPPVNWGNVRTWRDLGRFLSRREYWRHRHVKGLRDAAAVLWFYGRQVSREYGFLGAAAIVVGLLLLGRQAPAVLAMALCLVVLNIISMLAHARREDIFHWTRYMITAWFGLTVPLAFGWFWMVSAFPESAQPVLAFLLPLTLLTRFRRHDLSRHRFAEEYNRRILDCLPEGAILIAQDDNVVFPLMYLKYVEGLRPDVRLLEQGVHQLAPLKFNPRRDAVFCTHWNAAFNQPASARGPGLQLIPEGVIYRVVSTDMPYQPRDLWDQFAIPDMEDPTIPRNYLTRCLLGHVYFMRAEWIVPRDPVEALGWYERAARMAHDNAVLHYNLGLAFTRQGWYLLAQDAFGRAVAIDRKYVPPDGIKK